MFQLARCLSQYLDLKIQTEKQEMALKRYYREMNNEGKKKWDILDSNQ